MCDVKNVLDEVGQISSISISPSRFSVLHDEVEEGEISYDSQENMETIKDHTEKSSVAEQSLCQSLPRAKKRRNRVWLA